MNRALKTALLPSQEGAWKSAGAEMPEFHEGARPSYPDGVKGASGRSGVCTH